MRVKPPLASLVGISLIAIGLSAIAFDPMDLLAREQAGVEPSNPQDLGTSIDEFEALYQVLVANAANSDVEEPAVTGAIDGMLRTLDPHSNYFPPDEFRALREQQSGTYSGLGITVSGQFGRVVVASPPFPGTPAEKIGLRVGDLISHVNGSPIEGQPLDDVVSKLKGPAGTSVDITIVRPGNDKPIDLTIVRAQIEGFSVSNAFRYRDDVAYIKVDTFAETTSRELRDALESLGTSTISGLILDLRGNPGGLMQQAIEISDIFLEPGQSILRTRGRNPESAHEFLGERSNDGHQYPLVVVINRQSASASEIVAGAIQDHDRGLIVGETSFGKGLVQSVFSLRNDAGLALTTQKWYTPSGRLIQRDYRTMSDFDYYNSDLVPEPSADDVHYSDLGRVVYGGGGITPDRTVVPDPLNDVQDRLARNFVFYTFAQEYRGPPSASAQAIDVDDDLHEEFRLHLEGREIEITPEELVANREFVSIRIRYELIYNQFGVSEAARVQLDGDRQILAALEMLPEAAKLLNRSAGDPQ
jgi:carboxyl-terminal processing protease